MRLFVVASSLIVGVASCSHIPQSRQPAEEKPSVSALNFVQGRSKSISLPVICFVPGGPGLSSETLRSMDFLKRTFDLAFIDPPGSGAARGSPAANFNEVIDSLRQSIKKLNRPVILVGHSYGGIYVGALALIADFPLKGVVFVDTVLIPEGWDVVERQYAQFAGEDYQKAKQAFKDAPSEETFKNQMVQSSFMFFQPDYIESGRQLISRDRMGWRSAMAIESDPSETMEFAKNLKVLQIPKITIAGEFDRILPADFLKKQAAEVNSKFFLVHSGHFPTFENPEEVARIFEAQFSSKKSVR